MAESDTTRLGLHRWSADTDGPSRSEFDTSFANLEARAMIYVEGTLAGRPAAGTHGRIYTVVGDGTSSNNGLQYYDNGASWIALPYMPANWVGTTNLIDGSVTLAKMAANSVDASKIVDGSVGNAELANTSVNQAKLTSLSVGTAQLIDANVTLAKLASNSVDNTKIVDGSVGTLELADDAVTNAKLASSVVGTLELQDGAVTGVKLAGGALNNFVSSGQVLSSPTMQLGGNAGDFVYMVSTNPDSIYFYLRSSVAGGSPGYIQVLGATASQPSLTMYSPASTAAPTRASVALFAGNGASQVQLGGDVLGTSFTALTGQVYAGGLLYSPGRGTTTAAANVLLNSSDFFAKVTSVRAAKMDIEELGMEDLMPLLDIPVSHWHDRAAWEEENVLLEVPGVVAEDVEAANPLFAIYEDGELQGVAYDRIGVAWIPFVRDLIDRVKELEARCN